MKLYGLWDEEGWFHGKFIVWHTTDLRIAAAQCRVFPGWQVREIGHDGLPVPETADEPLVEEEV